jgi:surface polysaccharide O-acyltransferase-like enzyme
MLLPQHCLMLFNNWGETWYIHSMDLLVPSIIKNINSFWMMPLLFAIAGISCRYSLERRSTGVYVKERVSRLLVPLIFGLLLIIPVMPFIAGNFWNGHAGYFDSFTKVTDLSGYDGALSVGHLWFILFLFFMSMVFLPFMVLYKRKGKGTLGDKVPLILVILMALVPCIVQSNIFEVTEIGGKSILESSAYFLLGYFFLSNDNLLKKLDKYRFLLLGLFVLYAPFMMFVLKREFYEAASWLAILAILGLGSHYLNFSGKTTRYLVKSSFGVYLFHQPWIVVIAYFVINLVGSPWVQYPLVLLGAAVLTFLTYEIVRRIPPLRWMLGLKK